MGGVHVILDGIHGSGDGQMRSRIMPSGVFETTQVIAMDREAGGMAACTCELVELDGGKDVIIVFLV